MPELLINVLATIGALVVLSAFGLGLMLLVESLQHRRRERSTEQRSLAWRD